MYFRNIACCSIIRKNQLYEPPLVLINSDNWRSTVYCSVLDREVRGLKYLSGSQSFLSY